MTLDSIIDRLRKAPTLSRTARAGPTRICPICRARAPQFDVVDFFKCVNYSDPYFFGFSGISVDYFRCDDCYFMFTDFCLGWTTEEFAQFIYDKNYLIVDPDYVEKRPLRFADSVAEHLKGYEAIRLLDYGSGGGVFERRMHELGFTNVFSYDPFSQPNRPNGGFDIVTAFEVVEHTPAPSQTFSDIRSFLKQNGAIVASTELQPKNIETVRGNWHYAGPRNGHVSLYSIEAMCKLAEIHGFIFRQGHGLEIFSPTVPGAPSDICARIGGPPIFAVTLAASPSAEAIATASWGGIEQSARLRFRWTRQSRVAWTIETPCIPCIVHLTVHYIMEIQRDFAAQCKFEVDGTSYPATKSGAKIQAAVHILKQKNLTSIELVTPPCVSPKGMGRGDDNRELGLAIPIRN